jgi:hypothetical protein
MKKTYKFSVEVEAPKSNSSFIDGLIHSVKDEQNQLVLTHSINKKTTAMHREILLDLTDEMNEQLGKVGLKFEDFKYDGGTNRYQCSRAKMVVGPRSFVLTIKGESDNQFKDSKYTTFTGAYELTIAENSSPYYTAGQDREASTVKGIDDIFKRMEFRIKEYAHKINLVDSVVEKF